MNTVKDNIAKDTIDKTPLIDTKLRERTITMHGEYGCKASSTNSNF